MSYWVTSTDRRIVTSGEAWGAPGAGPARQVPYGVGHVVSKGVDPTPQTRTLCGTPLRDLFLWPDWPWERLTKAARCASGSSGRWRPPAPPTSECRARLTIGRLAERL
jgi:hypothetical protein